MNDLELQKLWQQANVPPPASATDMEIIYRMKRKMRKFNRDIFWRDARELVACGIVIYLFAPGIGGTGS